MAGVIGIYGLIIAVILAESIPKPNVDSRENSYSIYTGMAHVSETWWLLSHLTLFCESCHLSCIILTNNCTCISGPSAMCWPVLWTVRTRCWGLYRHCGRIWRAMCGLSSIEHYTISVETRIIWIFVSSWSRHWWRHWRFVREWRPEQTLCWNVDHADFFRGISIVRLDCCSNCEPTLLHVWRNLMQSYDIESRVVNIIMKEGLTSNREKICSAVKRSNICFISRLS